MSKFVYISGDDWNGIYKDGKLIAEGHSFSVGKLFALLEIECDIKIANDDWLYEVSSFPEKLEDVKYYE